MSRMKLIVVLDGDPSYFERIKEIISDIEIVGLEGEGRVSKIIAVDKIKIGDVERTLLNSVIESYIEDNECLKKAVKDLEEEIWKMKYQHKDVKDVKSVKEFKENGFTDEGIAKMSDE